MPDRAIHHPTGRGRLAALVRESYALIMVESRHVIPRPRGPGDTARRVSGLWRGVPYRAGSAQGRV